VKFLLDTHVFVRFVNGDPKLSRKQQQVLNRMSAQTPFLLASISLWEIANLASLERLKFEMSFRDWLEEALTIAHCEICDLTPAVAAEVFALGDRLHRDPADRVIVATARVHGATLVTSDASIIDADVVPTLW